MNALERSSSHLQRLFNIYLTFICFATACLGLYMLHLRNSWAMADWLINYSGGFVRRGLIGQLALTLSHLHISPFFFILALQYLLYAAIFYAAWCLLRGVTWNLWVLAFVYSPATLAFQILDPFFGFRKEILLFAQLALLLLLFSRRAAIGVPTLILYLCVFNSICIFSHEALIVFLPYLLCAVYFGTRDLHRTLYVAIPLILISIAGAALVSRHPGTMETSRTICASLGFTLTSEPAAFCSGAIAYLGNNSAFAHAQVTETMKVDHYPTLIPRLIVLAFLPILMAFFTLWRSPPLRTSLLALAACMALAFGASIVLFLYGTDWTRWIYIHIFCIFFLLIFLQTRAKLPAADPLLPAKKTARLAVYLVLGFYSFGWDLSIYQPRTPLGGLAHFLLNEHRILSSVTPG